MHILLYNNLATHEITGYAKLKALLEKRDFRSADVKKLQKNLYSARLDRSSRLLFSLHTYQQQPYILLLEYIHNHDYSKSRFLRRGCRIDESKLPAIKTLLDTQADQQPLTHLYNNKNNHHENRVQLLDKIISFDHSQQEIYHLALPLILAGSAGSGKSILLLEKMKQLHGRVLYITQSPYLRQSSHKRYYAHHYENPQQQTQFLCYQQLLESIEVPDADKKAMTLQAFTQWHQNQLNTTSITHTQALFEEFRGVITSPSINTNTKQGYLSKTDYLALGIKQSIFLPQQRHESYRLFERYLTYLKTHSFYDINLLSHAYLSKSLPHFDFIVIDEVQDMTTIQITLILHCLKDPANFMICGDANQLVHPNFFSWAKVKSLFLQTHASTDLNNPTQVTHTKTLTRVITSNYRNTPEITTLANQVLKLKNLRFGSIDHESHHLMIANQHHRGKVLLLESNPNIIKELNAKTSHSKDFAVIVLQQQDKKAAQAVFQTPLIFSIQECKGLEYKNIIIYNLVSQHTDSFNALCQNLHSEALTSDNAFHYARNKHKHDKSLDIYKFFVNALYVAITRAERNIYWLETQPTHPLFRLLTLAPNQEKSSTINIAYQHSSQTAWQEEASRLEAQGNSTQAQQVRQHVLQQTRPQWTVYAGTAISELFTAALEKKDKKAKLALFEYSLVYEDHQARNALMTVGFKPAFKHREGMEALLQKHFMSYQQNQLSAIERLVVRYGVNYRNPFNQTPLMIAAWLGKTDIIQLLNDLGADPLLANNKGLNAFQIALEQAYLHHRYAQQLPNYYDLLRPETLNIRLNKQLIVLSHQQPEFFLVNLMIAFFYRILPDNMMFQDGAFNSLNIVNAIIHFPKQLLPQDYYDREYINHILQRNQPFSYQVDSYPLFYPINDKGNYLLNPELQLYVEGEWLYVYEILWIDDLSLNYQENITSTTMDMDTNVLYQNILNIKKKIYKQLLASAMAKQHHPLPSESPQS